MMTTYLRLSCRLEKTRHRERLMFRTSPINHFRNASSPWITTAIYTTMFPVSASDILLTKQHDGYWRSNRRTELATVSRKTSLPCQNWRDVYFSVPGYCKARIRRVFHCLACLGSEVCKSHLFPRKIASRECQYSPTLQGKAVHLTQSMCQPRY